MQRSSEPSWDFLFSKHECCARSYQEKRLSSKTRGLQTLQKQFGGNFRISPDPTGFSKVLDSAPASFQTTKRRFVQTLALMGSLHGEYNTWHSK